jgi:hypothetical protein
MGREQQIPRCARNDKVYRSSISWPVQRSFVGSAWPRPSTPLPQDDIWGWEDSTATQDDSRGRAGTPVLHWGGNVVRFGLRAQLELSFGYLSRFGDGCYTRELWQ